jgi:hypothetical protein
MKPTYQTGLNARHTESRRPQGAALSTSPLIDWHFQSGADLNAGAVTSAASSANLGRIPTGLYALTQGLYDAQTKWEDRIEGLGLCVVIALASWQMMQAVYIALHTV